jgi:hypothetical protein
MQAAQVNSHAVPFAKDYMMEPSHILAYPCPAGANIMLDRVNLPSPFGRGAVVKKWMVCEPLCPHPNPLPKGEGTNAVPPGIHVMERDLIDRAEAIQKRIVQLRDSL